MMRPRHWNTLPLILLMAVAAAINGRPSEPAAGLFVPGRDAISEISNWPKGISDATRSRWNFELQSSAEFLSTNRFVARPDRWADVAIFRKAIVWALRFETNLAPGDVTSIEKVFLRLKDRMRETGNFPWEQKAGRVVRGYVSRVDGSVQPFGLLIPSTYNPARPVRLDVVLHGSSRPSGLSEIRFIAGWDGGDRPERSAPVNEFIELYPMGRVENCYRWAGETDVFEAIDAVCRKYSVDRNRIVLRGMSMGASGTWHLGLKHPDFFVALGPYCGYVDTHRFSMTPMGNFVKVGPLPWYQEKVLHMLDSVDYAANAGMVPEIAAIGDQDPFFEAHVIMGDAMKKEGLSMVNLISKGTGHVIDPATFQEQMRQIGEKAAAGLNRTPSRVRYVTWTLKYPKCDWLELERLEKHYDRAEFDGSIDGDRVLQIRRCDNIRSFRLDRSRMPSPLESIRFPEGQSLRLPRRETSVTLQKGTQGWTIATGGVSGKRPGVQGPIDDAFCERFLVVTGSGAPWNPLVERWATESFERFRTEWSKYFRGEVFTARDSEVSAADLGAFNLVLFGDPGSNRILRKALPRLPVQWSRRTLEFGGSRYDAATHAPVFIFPNPFPGGKNHYIVVNSGHTFHEQELAAVNYLLFPRHGDGTVMEIGAAAAPGFAPVGNLFEKPVAPGFFDENWSGWKP